MIRAVFPWLLGAVALGVGVLLVGGNSAWLVAFVIPAIIVGYVVIWP